jgi:hypothetical protein
MEYLRRTLERAQPEHYDFIAGRYKHKYIQDRIDVFVTAACWFSVGVIVGLIVAGCIAGISY